MKKSKLNLINDNLIWNASRRYKINSVVQYNGVDYQNITGLNSVPDLLIDWQTSSAGVSDLNGLSDVTITGTTANKILGSTTEGIWENKTIAQILGYTAENFANKQNSLTIDGTGVKYPTVDAVNAGLVLKSNIASPTFTGIPSAPTATVGTNTTQLATTAFVLANANSNALLLSGNQSFTGTKTGISSTVTPTVLSLTNNNNTTGSFLIDLINSSASSSNSSGAIRATNNNSDPSTSAAQINSYSSGMAVFVSNLSTGIGYRAANWDTGILSYFDSKTGSTGDLMQFTKNNSVTAKVDQNGNFSVQSITVLGTLGLRNVANTFTSFFTNANTASRTYTLPNRDITFAGLDDISNVQRNVIKNTTTSTPVTGTVSQTILFSQLIPANTFQNGDFFNIILSRVGKTGTAGTLTQTVRINTTNTLTGATTIALNTGIAANLNHNIGRRYSIEGGSLKGLGTGSAQSDMINSSADITSYTFNPAIDNYIFVVGQLSNASDSMFHSSFLLTN